MRRSKKYKQVETKIEKGKLYNIAEAISLAKDTSYTKFVGSLNLIINLNVPSKSKNESIKGSVTLPNQTGASVKIAIVAEGKDVDVAKNAGADEIGGDDLIKKIESGYTDFDVLIATPNMMPKLAKLGKVLGPKGLMPNPRNETVTTKVEEVVKSYKAGKKDFSMNDQNAIKTSIGKLDMGEEQLKENFNAFFEATDKLTKKFGPNRLKSIMVSPTMGPIIHIDPNEVLKIVA